MRQILSLLLLAAATSACCSDPVDGTSYFCLGDMSLEEELQLGSSYAPTIDATYGGVYADPEADQYLGALIREMAAKSTYGPSFKWNFTILNTSIPNAFAVPGGYIYITRGLLAAMETEGQFISVMGHELGHVEHRHSHQGMGKQALGGLVVGVLNTGIGVATGTEPPPIVGGILNAGAGVVLLRYDRNQESESDKRGVYYAAEMGYDPMEGVKTFEYFEKLEAESGGSTPEFLRTHPLNSTRIGEIKADIQQRYPQLLTKDKSAFRPVNSGNTSFQQIVARIAKAQPAYDAYDKAAAQLSQAVEKKDEAGVAKALTALQSVASRLPDEPLVHTAIGVANLQLDKAGPARDALQKAVQLDDGYLPTRRMFQPHYLLGGLALEEKEYKAAANEYKVATAAFPDHAASYYYLGVSQEQQGDKTGAKAAYTKAIEAEGDPNGKVSQQASARLQKL